MSSNSSSKRQSITTSDGDSINEHPAVKSAKREAESLPSSEVVELRKKVAELRQRMSKLENNYKLACRNGSEAQARVQFLENYIDTLPNAIDGGERLERENELWRKVSQLTKQLDEERHDHEQKVNDLTTQLDEERKGRLRDRERMDKMKKELDQLRVDRIERLAKVTSQLEAANKELASATGKNTSVSPAQRPSTMHQAGMPLPLQLQPPQMQQVQTVAPTQPQPPFIQQPHFVGKTNSMSYKAPPNSLRIPDKLHQTAHPTNILQICHPDAPDTISMDTALNKMREIMDEQVRKKVFKEIGKRSKDGECLDFECEVCGTSFINPQSAFNHFESQGHCNKVNARGGAVSFAAFRHWLLPLQPTSATPAAAASYMSGVTN